MAKNKASKGSKPDSLEDFFDREALLFRACNDIGMTYDNTRRHLAKDTLTITESVLLIKWQELWIEQEQLRKALSQDYERLKG